MRKALPGLVVVAGLLAFAAAMISPPSLAAGALEEWPAYGHDYGDSRYSPLSQITPANVASLKPVWTYHMRTPDRAARGFASSENTPIVVKGLSHAAYKCQVRAKAKAGYGHWSNKHLVRA